MKLPTSYNTSIAVEITKELYIPKGGHVFSFRVKLKRLSLPHIGFGPLESDERKVSQHFVCLDAGEVLFNKLVALRLLPLSDVDRFLDMLAVDAIKPKLVSIVVHVDAIILAFPHVVACLFVACLVCR